jgi:hypothetical protein
MSLHVYSDAIPAEHCSCCVSLERGFATFKHGIDAFIVHLYKRKGNKQVFDNHRSVYLLYLVDEILASS